MKINVTVIVLDHIATLRDERTRRLSAFDLFIFYVVPFGTGVLSYKSGFSLSKDFDNVSITFFGIFIALLLNIQVAMFGVFQRKWSRPIDDRVAETQNKDISLRRKLLMDLNANTSYLIVFCCLCLVFFLVLFAEKWEEGAPPAIGIFLYTHFVLTLLMIVKRSHALFHKEYRDSPD